MSFHSPGKTFADAEPHDVHVLAGNKVRGGDFRADRKHSLLGDPKLGKAGLRLDLRFGEVAALGLGHSLDLRHADTELQSRVPVPFSGAHRDHLAVVNFEHRRGDMVSLSGKGSAHANFPCQEASAHFTLSKLDFDIDPGGEIEL